MPHGDRTQWSRWADDADQLYASLRELPGIHENRRRDLYVMIAHARMLARQSPEELKRPYDRVQAGDFTDGEDLRRKLGLPPVGA